MKIRKNNVFSKIIAIVLTAVMLSGVGLAVAPTVNANAAESASDVYNKVQNSKGGVLGDDVKNKITLLGSDVQGLVLTVVMVVLIVSTLWTATKFTGAGDNPTKQAQLKTALTFQGLGLGFVASFSGLVSFVLKNLNLFS